MVSCVEFCVKSKSSLFGNFHRVGAFVAEEEKKTNWENICKTTNEKAFLTENISTLFFAAKFMYISPFVDKIMISGGRVLRL